MVLVVQRTDSIPNPPDNFPLKGACSRLSISGQRGPLSDRTCGFALEARTGSINSLLQETAGCIEALALQLKGHETWGNCSEDILCILKRSPMKKSWAYLQVSKYINQTKLSWNKDGIIHGVRYQDGDLVIQVPGLYFIICQLQFLVKCPEHPVDLKLELLINAEVKKQTLVTVCESGEQTKNIYQNLSQFLLEKLQVNAIVSVKVDKFQYVDTDTFPLENVLSIFLYSGSD
ncbi:Tumor necrosis factor ligand superfamily member 8 [Galemys pyrenaicus]|uniref:Tumor necrosis factor ligand superfamily member 8 n=1 Tax=Galemys pyrenaicus TaxID=202257 RepID=A0A8J6AGY0_GALPY|nr:Tumor necrosis factor ligand superfamily member 8 [Galemys pyrenaicus]